jgi:hypothetical protein
MYVQKSDRQLLDFSSVYEFVCVEACKKEKAMMYNPSERLRKNVFCFKFSKYFLP